MSLYFSMNRENWGDYEGLEVCCNFRGLLFARFEVKIDSRGFQEKLVWGRVHFLSSAKIRHFVMENEDWWEGQLIMNSDMGPPHFGLHEIL